MVTFFKLEKMGKRKSLPKSLTYILLTIMFDRKNNCSVDLKNCTGSRLEFEDATTSANSTPLNPSYRTRLISNNYSHCMEENSDGEN